MTKDKSTRLLTDFLIHSWPSDEVIQALERMRAVISALDSGLDTL